MNRVVLTLIAIITTGSALAQQSARDASFGGGAPPTSGPPATMADRDTADRGWAECPPPMSFGSIDMGRLFDASAKQPESFAPERTSVLSVGREYREVVRLRAGDVVFAGASSEDFDPALRLLGPDGKTVASNDDRAPNDQAPFLSFRAPRDGDYQLRVVAQAGGGGKFAIRRQIMPSVEVALDKESVVTPASDAESTRVALHLQLKAGQACRLTSIKGGDRIANSVVLLERVVGPTGVAGADLSIVSALGAPEILIAKSTGDYYIVGTWTEAEGRFRPGVVDFHSVAITDMPSVGAGRVHLAKDGVALLRTPLRKGDLRYLTLDGDGARVVMASKDDHVEPSRDGAIVRQGSTQWFATERGRTKRGLRLDLTTGFAYYAVYATDDRPVDVTLTHEATIPTLADETQSLGIGQCVFRRLHVGRSEVWRVGAASRALLPRFDLIQMNGDFANVLADPVKRTATDDLYFPTEGDYLIRISCDGFGGSGAVAIEAKRLDPKPISIGETQTVRLGGSDYAILDARVESRRYELVVAGATPVTQIDVIDDSGAPIDSTRVDLREGARVYLQPKVAGRLRVWIRGDAGDRRVRIVPFETPKP